jgi:acyl-CoA synthetase (AMP-forming)/AMP-acid ligase II
MQLPKLADIRREARAALWRARMVARVGRDKGMHEVLRWGGAKVLLRELPKGKQNPSLIFRFHAENSPQKAGLVCPGPPERAYSFFEMNERMDRIGLALSRRGLGKGTAALLMLKNRPEFVMLQPGLGRIGGAAVSVSWRSTAPELEYVAKHSGARALFFDAEVADTVRAALPNLPGIPRDLCIAVGGKVEGFSDVDDLITGVHGLPPDQSEEASVVMNTSGTTGKPKGAVRKFQSSALASALAFLGETPLRVDEVHLAVCPLYHATAFGFIGLAYLLGHSVVLLPEFRPETFLDAVQRYRVTSTALVPTMLQRLVDHGPERIREYDLSSLKAIFCGGAPLPGPQALEAMRVLGDKVYNFYGATETGLVTLASPGDLRQSPGTIGHAVPGVEIRLVDEAGRDVGEGEVGELYARSAMLVDGYHADADATRASMLDGYFSVGDLCRRDARGCYHIEGRKRDMIISGGVNVYPAEVEETLHAHPDVAEVAVVGVTDREWGERVRAFVALRPGRTPDEGVLKAWCKERLSGPKVPRDFVFVDALPRNPTGKVLKRELREASK